MKSLDMVLVASWILVIGGIILAEMISRGDRRQLDARLALVAPWLRDIPAEGGASADATFVKKAPGSREEQAFAHWLGGFGMSSLSIHLSYLGVRLLSATLTAVAARLLSPSFNGSPILSLGVPAAGAVIGWFVPVLLVRRYMAKRRAAVAAGLPDALELLVICAEAGLGLEDGIGRIVHELEGAQPALADELSRMAADLKIMPSRDEALTKFADRIDLPSVRTIATTLSQTMRYGTPLVQALRVVAEEMRNDTLIALEERANRLPALLTIPMMLLIVPTIFLIVGGPATLKLMDTLLR